jgi:hypothetical protein
MSEFLEGGAGEEAELHHESDNGSKNKGECSPRRGDTETLHQEFDEDNKEIYDECDEKTIGDKDTRAGWGCAEDMLDVERRKERKCSEDDQEEKKLKDGDDGFSHGLWR